MLSSLPTQLIEVTHDLEAATRADQCVVVDQAEVVFSGEPAHAVAHYVELMDTSAKDALS